MEPKLCHLFSNKGGRVSFSHAEEGHYTKSTDTVHILNASGTVIYERYAKTKVYLAFISVKRMLIHWQTEAAWVADSLEFIKSN